MRCVRAGGMWDEVMAVGTWQRFRSWLSIVFCMIEWGKGVGGEHRRSGAAGVWHVEALMFTIPDWLDCSCYGHSKWAGGSGKIGKEAQLHRC